MNKLNPLATGGRILSVDAFRGITILVMIFVNEVAGVRDIPMWLKHMPADADAMTFVDVVFPAFLFIVGMSVPFAIRQRIDKGEGFWQIQWHIAWRTIALLVMGVFMVNAEQGVHEQATGLSRAWWSLLFYISMILVWNVYRFSAAWIGYLLRGLGIVGLLVLAWIYRSGPDGTERMQPHWWGILGLIGWAYLYASILYQLTRGKIIWLIVCIAACIGFYMAARSAIWDMAGWLSGQSGNAVHTAVVLCGVLLTSIYFNSKDIVRKRAFIYAIVYVAILALAAFLIRPYFSISKIYATPSWALYSAASCVLLFSLMYWLVDVRGLQKWTIFFRPAAINPLLIYVLPGIWYSLCAVTGITVFPWALKYGWRGILWAILFSLLMLLVVRLLNKAGIRLKV